ncbi:MAG: hypothetical protein ACREKS_08145 [Candidatus Rokuibacteriota bacterium]
MSGRQPLAELRPRDYPGTRAMVAALVGTQPAIYVKPALDALQKDAVEILTQAGYSPRR